MAIIKDETKVQELAMRIFNNAYDGSVKALQMEDEKAIRALCSSIFPEDGTVPSQHDLMKFNNVVAKTATVVSENDVQQLLKYFADVQNVPYNTQIVRYTKKIEKHVRFRWAAVGSGVSMKRVETDRDNYIEIGTAQTAIYYNPLSASTNQVEAFRELVRDVAEARTQLIYDRIMALINAGIASGGAVPDKQSVNAANVTIAQFDSIANMLGRRTNSRPIFVADRELIAALAAKKVSTVTTALPDSLKMQYYELEMQNMGAADAIPLKNEFVNETSMETQYPINRGYILGGANGKKPFYVALAGGITQTTETEAETGRVKMIARQRLGAEFLYAGNIGVIVDTSVKYVD